jgi:hypothetical protein
MRSFRSSALALVTAGALAPLACASVLGDFSTGVASAPDGGGVVTGSDGASVGRDSATTADTGASDASVTPDTSTPSDTGSGTEDAPAPISLLNCNSWGNKDPALLITIENDAGGSSSNNIGQISVENLPTLGAARVIVGQNNPSSNVLVFTVYENFQQMNPPYVETEMDQAGLRGELHDNGEVSLLLQPFTTNQYEWATIDDTDMAPDLGNPTVAGSPIGQPPDQANGNNQFRTSEVSLSKSDYFTLASYGAIANGQTESALAYWISGMMGWTSLYEGAASGALVAGSPLIVSNNHVYGFMPPAGSSTNNGPTALSAYAFSDGTGGTLPTGRPVTAPGGMADLLAASSVGNAGAAQLAFVELVGAQGGDIRLGTVGAASLDTFMIDDLNVLAFKAPSNDAGFFDVTPFGNQNGGPGARWFSNGEFAVMGAGGTGGQSTSTGLNFYVATPDGRWLVEAAGSGSNVLVNQAIASSAFDYSSGFTQILRKYDVAWTVQGDDGSTSLYFNVLVCQ